MTNRNKSYRLLFIMCAAEADLKSEHPNKIVIDLYCKKGNVIFKQNSFQRCQNKKFGDVVCGNHLLLAG